MSTPNRYEQAYQEIEATREGLGKKLPKELPAGYERKYVVAFLKVSPSKEDEFAASEVSVTIQPFGLQAYEKLKKTNVRVLGFSKSILLHTPDDAPAKEPVSTSTDEKDATIAEQQKQIEELKAQLNSQPAKPAAPAKEPVDYTVNPADINIKNLNKDELIAFAESNELSLEGITKKDEILASLIEWQKGQKEQE